MTSAKGCITPLDDLDLVNEFLLSDESGTACIICGKKYVRQKIIAYSLASGRRHVRNLHADLLLQAARGRQNAAVMEPVAVTGNDEQLHEGMEDIPPHPEAFPIAPAETPLLRTANLSIFAAEFARRHCLSQRGIIDLLAILHLGYDFSAVKTFADVWHKESCAETNMFSVCRTCDEVNTHCNPNCRLTKREDFIIASLRTQIMQAAAGEDIFHFKPSEYRKGDTIRDIYDGVAYRSSQLRVRDRLNLEPEDVLLNILISVDGVQLASNSTGKSTWIIFAIIPELPQHRRYLSSKIMTLGIWQGRGKPPMHAMFSSVQSEIDAVNEDGMVICTSGGTRKVFLCIAGITSDKRGKEMLMDQASSNGPYGCSLCTIFGRQVQKGRGTCRSYAPSTNVNPVIRRTHLSIETDSDTAKSSPDYGKQGFSVNGMKGNPSIRQLSYVNMGHAMVIDQMHCCDCGISKKMMELWFNTKEKDFSLNRAKKAAVEKQLRLCQIPDCFSRALTDLNIANIKASGFKAWALHLSLPCLARILPKKYLDHWKLFVDAYSTLNREVISALDLQSAQGKLDQFLNEFEQLYGAEHYGINFHYAKHLPEMVDLWGPLQGYDMYPFEGKNGFVAARCHASGSILRPTMIQLLGSAVVRQKSKLIEHPEELRLVRRLRGERLNIAIQTERWRSFSRPGPATSSWKHDDPNFGCRNCPLKFFTNVEVLGVTVWSPRYHRASVKCCGYVACYLQAGGKVFVKVQEMPYCPVHVKLFLYGVRLEYTWSSCATLFSIKNDGIICVDTDMMRSVKPCIHFPFINNGQISVVTETFTSN